MDYNTDRERMVLPEYGRNIQNMVNFCLTIKDRSLRQQCAETIVKIMGQMMPATKEMPDGRQVLWDHLARMAHYRLDINYPVEITPEEETGAKPAPIAYPMTKIRYRHYGHLLEELIGKLSDMPEGEERNRLLGLTANQMRKALYYWNKDSLNEDKIATDIAAYTDGRVAMPIGKIQFPNAVPTGNLGKGPTRMKRGKK